MAGRGRAPLRPLSPGISNTPVSSLRPRRWLGWMRPAVKASFYLRSLLKGNWGAEERTRESAGGSVRAARGTAEAVGGPRGRGRCVPRPGALIQQGGGRMDGRWGQRGGGQRCGQHLQQDRVPRPATLHSPGRSAWPEAGCLGPGRPQPAQQSCKRGGLGFWGPLPAAPCSLVLGDASLASALSSPFFVKPARIFFFFFCKRPKLCMDVFCEISVALKKSGLSTKTLGTGECFMSQPGP